MNSYLPRILTKRIQAALAAHPVVIVTGARQTGKSTLIRSLLGPGGRRYLTLDDFDVLERAQREPDALLQSAAPLTLDEIQRSPQLLAAIKRAVDRERRPGRFLLSGSANLALLGRVSESLAGRAVSFDLHPFTLAEEKGRAATGPWSRLLTHPQEFEGRHPPMPDLAQLLITSRFPPAAGRRANVRAEWLDGYVRTYLERDLHLISGISQLVDFRRLMRLAALRSGGILNQTELARDAGLTQPTVHRYLNVLEASCLITRLPPYCVNRSKRLIKSPRLLWCDTGLAAFLGQIDGPDALRQSALFGPLLETLVHSDLQVWSGTAGGRPQILYWRTVSGDEVDFVVEHQGRVIPIEVKASTQPRLAATRPLTTFLDEYGDQAPHGLLLHGGTQAELLADRVWGIPLSVALGLGEPVAVRSGPVQD